MPSLLEHMAIAGLVALPLARKPKWILLLSWVAILPDLDIFLGLHRIVSHTLVLLIPISISVIGIAYRWFPLYREPAIFIAFCLLSHTLLDTLQYWNALLWPLPLAFWLNISFTLIPNQLLPLLTVGPMVAPLHVLFTPITGTLLGPLDTTLFLFFVVAAILRIYPHFLHRQLTGHLSPSMTS
ncbi:MAG: hypothetical protein ACFE8F_12440, partial [Promethearchaeota archaeon]